MCFITLTAQVDHQCFPQVFVQPFYRSVVGLPSELQVVRTHPGSAPSSPPQIIAARMLNSTAAFVAWTMLGSGEQTGPLVGYQVGMKHLGNSGN